jgi:hypothetical protein
MTFTNIIGQSRNNFTLISHIEKIRRADAFTTAIQRRQGIKPSILEESEGGLFDDDFSNFCQTFFAQAHDISNPNQANRCP